MWVEANREAGLYMLEQLDTVGIADAQAPAGDAPDKDAGLGPGLRPGLLALCAAGLDVWASQSSKVIQTAVGMANVGVKHLSISAERLEGANGPTPLSHLLLIAQPLAELSRDAAERTADRAALVVRYLNTCRKESGGQPSSQSSLPHAN